MLTGTVVPVPGNQAELIWVPGYSGLKDNEIVDNLAKAGSATPFTGLK